MEGDSVCGVCLAEYKDPRLLPCFHTLCRDCIDGLAVSAGAELQCPYCKTTFRLSACGAVGLPQTPIVGGRRKNGEITCFTCGAVCTHADGRIAGWCALCQYAFCTPHIVEHSHKSQHSASLLVSADVAINTVSSLKSPGCNEHHRSLSFYCETCDVAVCDDCETSGKHRKHTTVTMKDKLAQHEATVDEEFEQLRQVELSLVNSGEELKDFGKRLSEEAKSAKEQVKATHELVKGTVDVCVQQLLHEIDDLEEEREKKRGLQEGELERQLNDVRSAIDFRKRLRTSRLRGEHDDVNYLRLLQLLDARSSSLLEASIPEDVQHCSPISFQQASGTKLAARVRECIGRVLPTRAAAVFSSLDTDEMKKVHRGEMVTFAVEAKDLAGLPVGNGGDSVRAVWQVKPPGLDSEPTVEDKGNGIYAVSFSPQYNGEYSVEISINGKPLPAVARCVCESPAVDRFDQIECHEDISLSCDGRLATLNTGKSGYCSVLGSHPMRHRYHKWIVQLGNNPRFYNIGIATKPLSAGKAWDFEENNEVFCWQTDGFKWQAASGAWPAPEQVLLWQGKDKAQFVLDCDKHVLMVTNLRSGKSDSITGLPDSEFYPYFSMCSHNSTVKFVTDE